MRIRKQAAWAAAVILFCAGLAAWPLWLHGPSCGHDFDFHLQSWLAVNAAWHDGLLSPHWVAGANYNAGEPRLIFYPPVSWVLGALLGSVLPWAVVPQALTFLALAGCGFSFYIMARRWLRPGLALGAACVYLANPYLLFVAYERAAYGELLGAILIPPALLCSLREEPPVAPLAGVVAALWFTNAPSAVMGCYLVAFCALAASVQARRVRPVARAAAGLGLGTGLASVYIVPAWYEQRWVEIANAFGPEMRIEDSFLFGHTGEAFHVAVLHTASWIAVVLPAAGLAALAALGAVRLARSSADRAAGAAKGNILLPVTLTAILIAIFALQLPWSEPVWRLAPQMRFLQFPWRWLLVAGVVSSLALGLPAQDFAAQPGRRRYVAPVFVLALAATAWGAGLFAQRAFAQACDEDDNIAAQRSLLAPSEAAVRSGDPQGFGFEGTDEYAPAGSDKGEIQQQLPPVRVLSSPDGDLGDDSSDPNPPWRAPANRPRDSVAILLWQPEHKVLSVATERAGWAVLRLSDYPAWQVRLDGRAIPFASRAHRDDGLMSLPIGRGENVVEVAWSTTPDVWVGRRLSLLSLGLLLILAARRSRRRRAPL